MSADPRPFDAARGELRQGVTLVEASAGTGKTYAITMLVLRAVVELAVPLPKILIVTFTKAATDELRRRIRTLLTTAKGLLSAGEESALGDATLGAWVEQLADRRAALSLVQLALADIDGAEIYTIHGFCQRMLVDQALESGRPYEVELLTDIGAVREEIAADFWRHRLYPLAPLPCAVVLAAFATPLELLASVSKAQRESCRLEPRVLPELAEVLLALERAMGALVAWWGEYGERVEELFAAGLGANHFKKDFAGEFPPWWRHLVAVFSGEVIAAPRRLERLTREELLGQLNGSVLRGEAKRLAYLAPWPLPEEAVRDFLAAAANLRLVLRVELARMLRHQTGERLARRGCLGFDDLIDGLFHALQGPGGEAIRTVIGERYRVALIDEFQDTDSRQWRIFQALFGSRRHSLFLIGDPKQAIYRFRGADIQSYFAAREAAQERLTLVDNYRSHPLLLGEINRLFSSRRQPFFYPQEVLDYRPVRPGFGTEGRDLLRDGRSLAGMVYADLGPAEEGGRWTSGKASERLRSFVVGEIAGLLGDGCRPTLTGDGERPLAPRDVAILVRSHRQAEEYRQALAEAGIPAVLASRRSVFESEECRDLLLLLRAVADPGRSEQLKRALALPWFGNDGQQLYQLWQDEGRLERILDRFLDYQRRWREEGFLVMMYRLLETEGVLLHLAATPLAERAMANLFHLLELMQQAESGENLTIPQVLRWLRDKSGDSRGEEESELLLESDEDAVRLVTMHGAKGLEYPVVFCPYLWYRSDRDSDEAHQLVGYDHRREMVVDLGSPGFAALREAAIKEQLAEDLRLLYVAVTRAKIRCYVLWADVKAHKPVRSSFDSALGYLLFPEDEEGRKEQESLFADLANLPGVEVWDLAGQKPGEGSFSPPPRVALKPLPASSRSLTTDRQVSSYSALAMLSDYGPEEAGGHLGQTAPELGLPAGAGFGNVVHDLLDELPFTVLAQGGGYQAEILRKSRRHGVAVDGEALAKLLGRVVRTPLLDAAAGDNFTLADLDPRQCLKEMEFYLQVESLATARLNSLLAGQPGFVALEERTLRGHLTGFIDLICRARGRFHLIDYKTNFLGNGAEAYDRQALAAAMLGHNYGLQYWLYTVVLHRYLRGCLPGYRYADHFGGVLYLFVRGMEESRPGSGVFAVRPEEELVARLDHGLGEVGHG